ncbi:hypothetical protein CDD81_2553 [Ophiocordyceps australis]|uniref:DASH complex subunit DUO1 n=1 Tax=Ophiocordyceps australis TaxID=1399860 RepID=A0A2C5XYP1_9HYPO|nr:hypothetical protein CDD81_2553 [Ophiocordyceps australis]
MPESPDPDSHRPKTPQTPTDRPDAQDHDAALRQELESIRNMNESVEGILATLGRAGGNMEVVSQTVRNASTLLDTWSRILSQTEHNQRLLLHPGWQGATEDLAEQEAEELERQRAAERKAAQEEERREELRRRRQEEEDGRLLGASASSRGARGASRTRGTTSRGATRSRTTTSSRYGYTGARSRAAASSGRGASGTSRGEVASRRGRFRATR